MRHLTTILALAFSLGIAAPAFAAGGTSGERNGGQVVGSDSGKALDQFSAQDKKKKKKDTTQRSWWGGG